MTKVTPPVVLTFTLATAKALRAALNEASAEQRGFARQLDAAIEIATAPALPPRGRRRPPSGRPS